MAAAKKRPHHHGAAHWVGESLSGCARRKCSIHRAGKYVADMIGDIACRVRSASLIPVNPGFEERNFSRGRS